MKYTSLAIKTYLNKLAARTPAPGGGSAAALFGAIGCALLEKVVNYSTNKNNQLIKKSAALLKKRRRDFIRLVDEDAAVYNRLSVCYKRYGKNSAKTQAASKKATLVPLEVCKKSYEMTELCGKLQNAVNKNLISDVACAKTAFSSAFKSAKFNVDVNIKNIKDKKFVNRTILWQRYWMAKK